jgi:ATPase subunit of ABC transporter with duplicated ATPase domains
VKWAEKAKPGYFAQDHAADFADKTPLTEWIVQWVRAGGYDGGDVETLVRGTLGRLLFSGDEAKKPVNVISGGEQGRMLFGKLMLLRNNVLLMDEPTNHLDMESIESLNTGAGKVPGTLVFVSHDREFVSSLATRIIDIKPDRQHRRLPRQLRGIPGQPGPARVLQLIHLPPAGKRFHLAANHE